MLVTLVTLVVIILLVGVVAASILLRQGTATPEAPPGAGPVASQISVPTPVPGALGSGVSATSSWYTLYVTQPVYPDDKENHRGGIEHHLVDLMDRAERTLDVAAYTFDLVDVAEAMARAKQRGVQVRMVTDTDTMTSTDEATQAALTIVKRANIPIVDDQRGPIMHNKFTVVDGEWVSTGSWNYTDGDTYRLNNNMIVIRSTELAANYTAEFERLFLDREFGPVDDGRPIPHPTLIIDGHRVQSCFSPGGGCADLVVRAIDDAWQSIRFMAFSFTNDDIGQAMLSRADAGVTVQGVFENTGANTPYAEYGPMADAGLDVYTDGSPYTMHHKVIIIDDRTVVFGSFNFSANADRSNNENLLIVDDPTLAQAFGVEFDTVLDVAKNPPERR